MGYRVREVVISPRAIAESEAADAWWSANRLAAPDLFAEQLLAALELLAVAAEGVGTLWSARSDVRRILLPRVRFHAYYRIEGTRVVVVAVWHARRRPPRIGSR
jgi:plasmid stabilization system protein ParE